MFLNISNRDTRPAIGLMKQHCALKDSLRSSLWVITGTAARTNVAISIAKEYYVLSLRASASGLSGMVAVFTVFMTSLSIMFQNLNNHAWKSRFAPNIR